MRINQSVSSMCRKAKMTCNSTVIISIWKRSSHILHTRALDALTVSIFQNSFKLHDHKGNKCHFLFADYAIKGNVPLSLQRYNASSWGTNRTVA